MKFNCRNPFHLLGLVLAWRVALLVFTAQPIPANDAYIFDGGVANWLHGGRYVIPCMSVAYPISSGQIFSLYPPVYQLPLWLWMFVFGTSAPAAMAMHLIFFATAATLTVRICQEFFPKLNAVALPALLLFAINFNDRPEDLAHVFGLTSLLLVGRQISGTGSSRGRAAGIVVALFLALYTSIIVGTFYFGAGFLACATAWCWGTRHWIYFLPYVVTTLLFAAVTATIARVEPLWWHGFLENATKQSAVGGFHLPHFLDLVKLVRNTPVFLVTLGLLPWLLSRCRQLPADQRPWLYLTAGIFTMGWMLLLVNMTLLSPDYVFYVLFSQVLLATGLLALAKTFSPAANVWLRRLLWGCVLLVSVRAIGMSTWGAACAWKNSYAGAQTVLHRELTPFVNSPAPVVISSQFLYGAQIIGVTHPIHSDWYYDRALTAPDADWDGFLRLRPTRLLLGQFDYYRSYLPLLARLRQHPELVTVNVRDCAQVRPPDAIPALARVVQHISWAPVIVDLEWK